MGGGAMGEPEAGGWDRDTFLFKVTGSNLII